MKKKYLLLLLLAPLLMGQSYVQNVQPTSGPLTKTIPVITNGTISTVVTVVAGTGSTYVAWALENEDSTNGFRCEFGTTTGTAPVTTPTSTVGLLIPAGQTYIERTAPNNRVDCIAAAGSPKYSLVQYPK